MAQRKAAKTTEASTTPANDFLPRLARWYHAHSPEAGRNEISTVLSSAATPQSNPNQTHGFSPSRSSIVSVSHRITANSNGERLVSQTQRVHQYIA